MDNNKLIENACDELTYAESILMLIINNDVLADEHLYNTLESIVENIKRARIDICYINVENNTASIDSEEEIKRRSAPPNQNSKLSENKLHGAIGDINNVELSLHQLKSDIYENKPDTPTLYAQLDLMTNTLSKSIDNLEKLVKEGQNG